MELVSYNVFNSCRDKSNPEEFLEGEERFPSLYEHQLGGSPDSLNELELEQFEMPVGRGKKRALLCVNGLADDGLWYMDKLAAEFLDLSHGEAKVCPYDAIVGFIWPSSTEDSLSSFMQAYTKAMANSTVAAEYLSGVVKFLRGEGRFDSVDVIGHSLGARVVLEALKTLQEVQGIGGKNIVDDVYLVGAILPETCLEDGKEFSLNDLPLSRVVVVKSSIDLTLRFSYPVGEMAEADGSIGGEETDHISQVVFGKERDKYRALGNYGVDESFQNKHRAKLAVLDVSCSHNGYFDNAKLLNYMRKDQAEEELATRVSKCRVIHIHELRIGEHGNMDKFAEFCSQLLQRYQGSNKPALVFTGQLTANETKMEYQIIISYFSHLIDNGFKVVHTHSGNEDSIEFEEVPNSVSQEGKGINLTYIGDGSIVLLGIDQVKNWIGILDDSVMKLLDDMNANANRKIYVLPYFENLEDGKKEVKRLQKNIQWKISKLKSIRLFKTRKYYQNRSMHRTIVDVIQRKRVLNLVEEGNAEFQNEDVDQLLEGRELVTKQPSYLYDRKITKMGVLCWLWSWLKAVFYLLFTAAKQMIPILGSILLQFYFKMSYGVCSANPEYFEPLDIVFFIILLISILIYGIHDDYPNFKKKKRKIVDIMTKGAGFTLMVVDGILDVLVMFVYLFISPPLTCWGFFKENELALSLLSRGLLVLLFFVKVGMVFIKQYFKWNVSFMRKDGSADNTLGQKIRNINKELKHFGRKKKRNKAIVYESVDLSNLQSPDQAKKILKRMVPFFSIPVYFTIVKILQWANLLGFGQGGNCNARYTTESGYELHSVWVIVFGISLLVFVNQVRISIATFVHRKNLVTSMGGLLRLVAYAIILGVHPGLSVLAFVTFIMQSADDAYDFPCYDNVQRIKYVAFFGTAAFVAAFGTLAAFLDRDLVRQIAEKEEDNKKKKKKKSD